MKSNVLFVSGYTSANEPGIQVLRINAASNSLSLIDSFTGVAGLSFFAFHPNKRWLYAVGETQGEYDRRGGSVLTLHISENFAFEHIDTQTSDGIGPCHICLDQMGRLAIVSNYYDGRVSVYRVLSDGKLEQTQVIQHYGSSIHPERQTGPHAHSALFTPNNRSVLVADLGKDEVVYYEVDFEQGSLAMRQSVKMKPGAGPRHFVFHPNGKTLYVANELNSTVSVCEFVNGKIRLAQTLSTLPPNAPHNQVADIHFNETTNRLFVSNRGHNSITVFDVANDGELKRLGVSSCGGNWPRNFAVSPDGDFVVVANQMSDSVDVLPILPNGELGDVRVSHRFTKPACVRFI
jgi:6-phosphogluconolactonase